MSTLKKPLILIAFFVVGYFVVNFIGGIQLSRSFIKCTQTITNSKPKPLWKTEDEARKVSNEIIECVEKRNGLFARLFFDKEDIQRSFKYSE